MDIGQIVTAKKVDAHEGKLIATPDQKLVFIFLGTCPEFAHAQALPVMRQLGWTRGDMYEVAVDVIRGDDRISKRTLFQADDPIEAIHAACRFSRKVQEDECVATDHGGWYRDALHLNVVRFGMIDEEGQATNQRGDTLFHWKAAQGISPEDAAGVIIDGSQRVQKKVLRSD